MIGRTDHVTYYKYRNIRHVCCNIPPFLDTMTHLTETKNDSKIKQETLSNLGEWSKDLFFHPVNDEGYLSLELSPKTKSDKDLQQKFRLN